MEIQQNAIIAVITFVVLAIYFVMITVAIVLYQRKQKTRKLVRTDDDRWLFSDFYRSIYHLFYPHAKSDKICSISRKEYERYCKIIHIKEDYENIVGQRTTALICLIGCLVLAYVLRSSTSAMIAFLVIGTIAFYFLWIMPYSTIKSQVEKRLFHIVDDMPRFLSLMEKAMDLPVDQAMITTARKFKSPLSEDIIDSINKVSLGADGWETTLTNLAKLYDLEDFSDLILEIVNSYDQGLNIRPVIQRKAYEVEQKRMLSVEEHDTRIKNLVFIPIIMLKVVPMMILVALPMFTQI